MRRFVQRWRLEVTPREVRDHPGLETQRHRAAIRPEGRKRDGACEGSDRAIARTTPRPLGMFSVVTLLAARLTPGARTAGATAAWYRKERPTFVDTLAAVRRHIWAEQGFSTSRQEAEAKKHAPDLHEGVAYALRHAA